MFVDSLPFLPPFLLHSLSPSLPSLLTLSFSLSPTLSGWEYSVEAGLGAWVPYERNVHLCRRRRWVRLRKRDKDSKAVEKRKVFSISSSSPSISLSSPCPPPFISHHFLFSLLIVSPHLPLHLLTLTAQASEGIGGGLGICPLG